MLTANAQSVQVYRNKGYKIQLIVKKKMKPIKTRPFISITGQNGELGELYTAPISNLRIASFFDITFLTLIVLLYGNSAERELELEYEKYLVQEDWKVLDKNFHILFFLFPMFLSCFFVLQYQ